MATTNPLFKFGVDLESVDGEGKTALHRAAMFSDQEKVLLPCSSILHSAVERNEPTRAPLVPTGCLTALYTS